MMWRKCISSSARIWKVLVEFFFTLVILLCCGGVILQCTDGFHVITLPNGPQITIYTKQAYQLLHTVRITRPTALQQQIPPYIQVVSDVDDTLKSSGGINIAGVALGGIDVQYERGSYYPGVAEFMLQLSLGPTTTSLSNPPHPAKVAILTARAEEFKAALELKPDNPLAVLFRKTGEESAGVSEWGFGPVLYGSVAEWIVQDRKGFRKFTNFERLIQQDPTGTLLNYVYIGDTGELDAEAGETILREYPHLVQAVFLHVVCGELNQDVLVPPPKIINGRVMMYFRTYVGAATDAVQLGLISIDGLKRVINAASLALHDISRSSDKWLDLQRDIDRAHQMLTIL
jgi:hypothetical protein